MNSFNARATIEVGSRSFEIYRLDALAATNPDLAKLPVSIRVLLENLLRHEDGGAVNASDIEKLAKWSATNVQREEIAFTPARVLMQDFTGVPAVVDLAAMRDAIFVLGQYAPATPGRPDGLADFVSAAQTLDLSWSLCAFGRDERACLLAAIRAGGNVRVGFENNLETPEGRVLQDNAASVAALVKAASLAGHTLKRN